jgi:glutamyl-tRNA reductase
MATPRWTWPRCDAVPILALGVSYRRASVELLERLAFGKDDLPKAYHHLTGQESVGGAVILSTCNRAEVFAEVDAYHSGFQALKSFLSDSREVPPADFAEPLYSHYEEQAVEHLFSVAAGLDSMVLGEPQILSQVRQAYVAAEQEAATGSVLRALFRRAIRVGRRARAETAIGASPAAFVEAGATLAEEALGGLSGRHLLVVGAGQMSELAVRRLRDRGIEEVRVLARRPERAEALARRTGVAGRYGPLTRMREALVSADVVVSATGAAGVVIDLESLEHAVAGRGGRPLFLLDLAVPRDVDAHAAELPGVRLANIDHLKAVVHRSREDDEIDRVQAIVAEEVARFGAWRRAAELGPLIQQLYERAERIREAEVERLRRLSARDREAVDAATRAIVAKLLHRPVVRAKELHDAGDLRARLLAELFDLKPPPA